jgi:excinuclease ABC subunit B
MYSPEWAIVPEVEAKDSEEEFIAPHELPDRITALRHEMMQAADELEYERAAELRDQIKRLERKIFGMDQPPAPAAAGPAPGSAGSRMSQTRGRKGAGAAAAGAQLGKRPVRPGRLKLTPDRPP